MCDLTVCAVLVTTGEDLTECNIADSCVGPAFEQNDNGVGCEIAQQAKSLNEQAAVQKRLSKQPGKHGIEPGGLGT